MNLNSCPNFGKTCCKFKKGTKILFKMTGCPETVAMIIQEPFFNGNSKLEDEYYKVASPLEKEMFGRKWITERVLEEEILKELREDEIPDWTKSIFQTIKY